MRWCLEFHRKGKKEVEELSSEMKAKLRYALKLLQERGPSYVREPYVKFLRDKLWEIRLQDQDGIARVLYILASKQRIILLHAFIKKTQKTPGKALAIALKRMKEIENE